MHAYASGDGHWDLARRLGISHAINLAISGSANGRILRTTMKHATQHTEPTLYVLGMTFTSRDELPILEPRGSELDWGFEGRWTNPQNQQLSHLWQPTWQQKHTDLYVELKLNSEMFSIRCRLENLMYQILAMIQYVHSCGHRVLVYQQADTLIREEVHDPAMAPLRSTPAIMHGYAWQAIPWQHAQGVAKMQYADGNRYQVPDEIAHRAPGHHDVLNQYLCDYIQQYEILL